MSILFRMLLVVVALLASGAPQLAATAGDDGCCPEERGAEEKAPPCSDCPPGLACACYPIRGAVQSGVLDVAPATAEGTAVSVTSAEPRLRASVTDIFHPPRA